MTPAEYAASHGITRRAVYARLQRGTLRGRRFGGRWRVLASEK